MPSYFVHCHIYSDQRCRLWPVLISKPHASVHVIIYLRFQLFLCVTYRHLDLRCSEELI